MIYPRLFSPIKIGNLELSNRLIMAAMHMGYTIDGLVTDQFKAFYRERAKGKPGMILVGGAYTHPTGKSYKGMLSIENDDTIPGLKEVAAMIRAEGVAPAVQLIHGGRYAHSSIFGGEPAVSASAVPSAFTRETPRELPTEEVEEIVDSYGQAARRAKEAGFALVEVLGGTGYLVSQFLSAITNQRTDKYGGDLSCRMTFLREIIASVRSQVGDDFPVSCRISGDELMPGGNTITEMTELVKVLEKDGVNLISVCGGWHETQVPLVTPEVPPGTYAYFTRTFKEHVDIPLAVSNRVNHPAVAEEILTQGQADAIVMGRPFLADPLLALKGKEGREESIRPCLACNQGCLDSLFVVRDVTCLVNPRVGCETEPAPEEKPLKKRILVVGSGPAGMEAARVAAMRGAQVTLAEAHPYLGGQLILAGAPVNRKTFLQLLPYYKNELKRLDVDLRLEERITPDSPLVDGADTVILATGGKPIVPNIPGGDSAHVMTAWEVLSGQRKAVGKVVIVGGGATGCEMAIYLATRQDVPAAALNYLGSRNVTPPAPLEKPDITILEMQKHVGHGIGITSRWVTLQELKLKEIRTITYADVKSIEPGKVVYVDAEGNQNEQPADSVVLAVGAKSFNPLEEALSKQVKDLHVIGDALTPGKAIDAIRTGYRTAMELV
ncbi:FAD-dependent oxidoreductase [Thermodesulfobacteriota bacterium]